MSPRIQGLTCDHFFSPSLCNLGGCNPELAGPWLWFCDLWKGVIQWEEPDGIPWNCPLLAEAVRQKQCHPRKNCKDLVHHKTLKDAGVLTHHIPIQLTHLTPKCAGHYVNHARGGVLFTGDWHSPWLWYVVVFSLIYWFRHFPFLL